MITNTDISNTGKVAVICIGGAGTAIGRVLSERAAPAEIVVVNTDLDSLRSASAERIFKIECAQNASVEDVECAAKGLDAEFRKFVKEFDHVCIVSAMGGKTGTGASPVLTRICSEMNILVSSFVVMPFSFEDRKTAEEGLKSIRGCCSESVHVFNNDDILSTIGADAQFSDILDAANERVADAVIAALRPVAVVESIPRPRKLDAIMSRPIRSIATI